MLVWYINRCLIIISIRPFTRKPGFPTLVKYICIQCYYPKLTLVHKIKILEIYRSRSLFFFFFLIHGVNPFCYLTGLYPWSYLNKIMLNFQMVTNEKKGGENNWCPWHSMWLWAAGGMLLEQDYEINTHKRIRNQGKASQSQYNLRRKSELK